VGTFLEALGRYDLLDYMNKFWVSRDDPNPDFWAHEFSKHATCFSTFDIPCYGPEYVEHEDVVEFFETAILFDNKVPTWGWLATEGIRPSNSTTYSLSDMQAALTTHYGALPFIGCSGPRYNETVAGANSTDNGRTEVSEVWYYAHVFGRPQNGASVPVEVSPTFTTTCARAEGALHYYERSEGADRFVY